jgi:hypothetical protein
VGRELTAMMLRSRLQKLEALAIAAAGLILLFEIARAVQFNLLWMDHSTATEPRFSLYLWTALSLVLLLVFRGVAAMRSSRNAVFLFVEGPLTLLVSAMLIIVVHGWRIHTDVVPLNSVESADALPLPTRLLASPSIIYGGISIAAVPILALFWRSVRTPTTSTRP